MHVGVETLQLHIDYTIWASKRLLNSAAALTPKELTRDFGTADKSVLGTLLHVYSADFAWIERMFGRSIEAAPYDENSTLEWLQVEWPKVWDRWKAYVGALTAASAEAEIAYRSMKGDPFRSAAWKIVMHVVNHGTHQRGQAAGFMRSMGKTPPTLDLMFYYRELG
jgi:uncharacterized damage-inducible protein DinB